MRPPITSSNENSKSHQSAWYGHVVMRLCLAIRIHALSGGLTLRAPAEGQPNSDKTEHHHTLPRRTFPPPHVQLTHEEAIIYTAPASSKYVLYSITTDHTFPVLPCARPMITLRSTPKSFPFHTGVPNSFIRISYSTPRPSGWETALPSPVQAYQSRQIDRTSRTAAANAALSF